MVATAASLRTKYPQFASKDTDHVDAILVMINSLLEEPSWGDQYDNAVELLTCHFLKMDDVSRHGASGAVSSKSKTKTVGQTGDSRTETLTFALGLGGKTLEDDGLRQTAFGRLYLILRASQIMPVV